MGIAGVLSSSETSMAQTRRLGLQKGLSVPTRAPRFSPYRSGVLSAGAQLSFLSGSAVSENCANFASSIGLKLALTRSAFRMTLFRISVSVVLALSTIAPSLRAADATRELVIDVVKKFAHSWETGDLAAFTSSPFRTRRQQRTGGSSFLSNVNGGSDEFLMIRQC
jgi:hypothetical protein